MRFSRMINVVGVHAEGELNEVITGGVLDVPGKSVFEKMEYLQTKADWLRQFLLNEPRGKVAQCVNLVVPACDPKADAGFVLWVSGARRPKILDRDLVSDVIFLALMSGVGGVSVVNAVGVPEWHTTGPVVEGR